MNAAGVGIMLVYALEEMERKKQNHDLHRRSRDASNPFSLPEANFRKLYRFTREVCRDLFLEIEHFLKQNKTTSAIPKIIKMFTSLHFFAHGSYQKSVGKDYHSSLSQASVGRSTNDVVNVIDEHLSDRYIQFPTTRDEMDRVKRRFFQKFNFSDVVGAIDYTHIAIVPPPAV